jgi:hypothetical protein
MRIYYAKICCGFPHKTKYSGLTVHGDFFFSPWKTKHVVFFFKVEEREHRHILTVERKLLLTLISTTRIIVLDVNEFHLVIRVHVTFKFPKNQI